MERVEKCSLLKYANCVLTKPMTITFKSAIRKWRSRNRLTQESAAQKLKVPVGTLRNWEQGRVKPNNYTITAIVNEMERHVVTQIETR